MIKLERVSKIYQDNGNEVKAVDLIDIDLQPGEKLAIVGPSGCGKSTILLMMAGLIMPTLGRVTFQDSILKKNNRDIALVLQDYGLFPWKTVRKNVELGLTIRNDINLEGDIVSVLEELEIADKIDSYPQQLSGGQKQRVALARALVLKPSLLLLDEPFAALDTITREKLQDLLASIQARDKFTMVIATHNIQEAVRLGDKIAVMSGKPGKIVSVVENLKGEKPQYRGSDEFHKISRQIRTELSKVS